MGWRYTCSRLTDNRNRAGSDIRSAFTRNGGNLGEPGSVAYLFEQKGYLLVEGDEDEVMMAALDAGAEDIKPSGDGQFEVITAPGDLGTVRRGPARWRDGRRRRRGDPAPTLHHPGGSIDGSRVLRLVDALEDLDDVQAVHANFDIDERVLAELG